MFIAFEGIDGSGKSVLSQAYAEKLRDMPGAEYLHTTLPSNSDVGKAIRARLRGQDFCTEHSLAYLLIADHIEHAAREVVPYVTTGVTVVCDRWLWSTYAYQRKTISWDMLDNLVLPKVYVPDHTFFLRIPPELAEERRNTRARETGVSRQERFEQIALQREIAQNYEDLFAHFFGLLRGLAFTFSAICPQDRLLRLHVLDATKPVEVLLEEVFTCLRSYHYNKNVNS